MGFMDFLGGGIVEAVGKVADDLITSDEERAEKENEKLKTNLSHKVEMAKLGIEDKKLREQAEVMALKISREFVVKYDSFEGVDEVLEIVKNAR